MSKQIRGRVKQTPLDLEYKKQIEKIVHSKNKPTKGIEPVHPPEQDLKDDSWNSYFWHYGPQIGAAVSLLLLASYISVSALKDNNVSGVPNVNVKISGGFIGLLNLYKPSLKFSICNAT